MWVKLAKCLIIPRQTLFAIAKWNTRMFWPPLALKFMSTLFRLPVILKKKRENTILTLISLSDLSIWIYFLRSLQLFCHGVTTSSSFTLAWNFRRQEFEVCPCFRRQQVFLRHVSRGENCLLCLALFYFRVLWKWLIPES